MEHQLSKIKAQIYIQQKSGKLVKDKKVFMTTNEVLEEARSVKEHPYTYTFRITYIFKGGAESGDVISWDGRCWGGSLAVDMLQMIG